MSPPGEAVPVQNRTDDRASGGKPAVGAALVTHYVHLALSDPQCAHMSVHRVSKAVRRFLARGLHERDLVSWVIGYVDKTGEEAVRNVMRERGY